MSVFIYLDGDPTNYGIDNMIIAPEEMFEPRTYKCFCGAEFIVRFPENCNWDDYESGALEDAGWALRGQNYFCPIHARDE